MVKLISATCLFFALSASALNVTNFYIYYTSSIDDKLTNLVDWIAYDLDHFGQMPVLGMAHPYTTVGGENDVYFNTNNLLVMATNQCFVVAPGLRGRRGANGSPNDSGTEIVDLIDGVNAALNSFPTLTNPTNKTLVGYSGGGGNAYGVAIKFPDYFNFIVGYFGMSDYASWWVENGQQSDVPIHVGGSSGATPNVVPNKYLARNATNGIGSFRTAFIRVFQNSGDTTVFPVQSDRLVGGMVSAGLANYAYSNSASLYQHGLPNGAMGWVPDSYSVWSNEIVNLTYKQTIVAANGSLPVTGFIITKRFSVWLSDGMSDTATDNYSPGRHLITPLTGTMGVTVTEGARSITKTISGPTLFDFGPTATILNSKVGSATFK
jgi:hypothetical protein